jgi:hypothetical protein
MFDPLEASPVLPALLASDRSSAELALRRELAFVAFGVAQPWEASAVPGAGRGASWTLLSQTRSAACPLLMYSVTGWPSRADLGPTQRSCKGCRLDSMLWLPASSRRPLIRQ